MLGLEQMNEPPQQRVTEAVARELEQIGRPKANWAQGVVILAMSFVLFVSVLAGGKIVWSQIGILVGVLVFHELGHLAAMRAFGYQDLRMFFLPFFGAAVSGYKPDATSTQRAIVALAGPIPGILVGIPLVIAVYTGSITDPHLAITGVMLVAVNAFNLLPFEPLDGGRFMGTVVFGRSPGLEAAFRLLGVIGLGLAAWKLGNWVLGVVAVFMLIAMPYLRSIANAARDVTAKVPAEELASIAIPVERREAVAESLDKALDPGLRQRFQPKNYAAALHQVWTRARDKAPRAGATAGLLASYCLVVGGVVGVAVIVYDRFTPTPISSEPSERLKRSIGGFWIGQSRAEVIERCRGAGFYPGEQTRTFAHGTQVPVVSCSGLPDTTDFPSGFDAEAWFCADRTCAVMIQTRHVAEYDRLRADYTSRYGTPIVDGTSLEWRESGASGIRSTIVLARPQYDRLIMLFADAAGMRL